MRKMRRYNIEYDPEADVAYIRIEHKKVADTVEIENEVYADLDSKRHVIGVEILKFSKRKAALISRLISKGVENIAVAR